MDFEDVLRRWEELQRQEAKAAKERKGPGKMANAPRSVSPAAAPGSERGGAPRPREPDATRVLEGWLNRHGVSDKDAEPGDGADDREARIEAAARLRRLEPQAVLDLHGKTATEARGLLTAFLASSMGLGLEKVLVVHGKGNHSVGDPVVAEVVRQVLEESPIAGAFGPAERHSGGTGATWVVLRKRPIFRDR